MSPRKSSSRNSRRPPERKSDGANSNPFDRQRSFLKQRYAVLRPTAQADTEATAAPHSTHLQPMTRARRSKSYLS